MPRHPTLGLRLAFSAHETALAVTLLAAVLIVALFGAGEMITSYVTAAAQQVQLLGDDFLPRQDPGPIYRQADPPNKVAPVSPKLIDGAQSN